MKSNDKAQLIYAIYTHYQIMGEGILQKKDGLLNDSLCWLIFPLFQTLCFYRDAWHHRGLDAKGMLLSSRDTIDDLIKALDGIEPRQGRDSSAA